MLGGLFESMSVVESQVIKKEINFFVTVVAPNLVRESNEPVDVYRAALHFVGDKLAFYVDCSHYSHCIEALLCFWY